MTTTTRTLATVLSPRRRRSVPGRWKADLLGIAAIASVVVTVWIWARSGGILQTFVFPQYAIESQSLLTGLLATTLMALQVLYMARIPWVEQAWGHDVLARRHRLLGFWSFWLMIAHVVLFAWSRATEAGVQGPWTALYQLFIGDPWMLMASIGTFMIIVVVVTSIRAARARIRYESWHLIHLYAYLGIVFAFPHQLFDGTHFHELWTQTFWWIMLLVPLTATLLYRVIVPLQRSLRHHLRVAEIRDEAPGVASITMNGRDLDALKTKSGQFFIWRFLGGAGWTRGHPYTISAAPRADSLRITVQAAGDGSERAHRIRPGTRVLIEGPYGVLTTDARTHDHLVMIAAGVGITPFTGMLEDGDYGPGDATLIFRVRDREHAIHLDELEQLAERRGIRLILLPGRRRSDDSWLPQGSPEHSDADVLIELTPQITDADVFICGPAEWNNAVRDSLRRAGVPKTDIHIEDFSW